jgi:hypothetical protein
VRIGHQAQWYVSAVWVHVEAAARAPLRNGSLTVDRCALRHLRKPSVERQAPSSPSHSLDVARRHCCLREEESERSAGSASKSDIKQAEGDRERGGDRERARTRARAIEKSTRLTHPNDTR